MSIPGIIVAILLAVTALVVVAYPLVTQQLAMGESARRQLKRDELLTSYERVVTTIRDLDEDFRTGKMNQDDYQPERELWAARGVELLQQLEALGSLPLAVQPTPGREKATAPNSPQDGQLDSIIEDAVAKYVAALKNTPSANDEVANGTPQGVQR